MENVSINCLNVEKKVKGSLLISGISDMKELQKANLHCLSTDITHEQIDVLKKLTEKVKDMQDKWQQILEEKKLVDDKPKRRRAIFLVKNLQLGDADSQEDYFLDEVFGLGEITEVCGPSGCCKTQIAMQLCLNVQTPKCLGGQEGEALFVDTNGDLFAERLLEMAK